MIFHTAYKGGRPVCLSEETRAFAEESLRGKYGDETLKTPFVTMDDVAGFGEREDYDKYDEMIRRIAERAPVRVTEREKICGAAARIENVTSRVPFYIDADSPAIQTLINTYNDVTGEGKTPFTMGGGTYARELPNAVAFGPTFPGTETNIHNADENIEVTKLYKLFDIYKKAVVALDELY